MSTENSSEEDQTKFCDSCSFRGLQKSAVSSCTECEEYLCYSCDEIHRSFKATRGHTLNPLTNAEGSKYKPPPAFMLCDHHGSESLSLFCVEHNKLCCKLCKKTIHRKCTLKTLNEKADEDQTKKETTEFLVKLKATMSDLERIKVSRQNDKSEVEKCAVTVRGNLEKIKVEFLAWLDTLEKKLGDELATKENGLMEEIDNHIETSEQMLTQLNEVLDSIERLDDQEKQEKFTLMTKSKEHLEHGKQIIHELSREIKPVEFMFRESDELKNVMTSISALGEITHASVYDVDINFCDISSVTKREAIPDITHSVTGFAFMPDGRLVICDGYSTNCLKVFTPGFKLKGEVTEDSGLWDVAVIDPDNIVVTGRDSKKLHFFHIFTGIEKKRSIDVDIVCYGIDYKDNKLFVCGSDECHKKVQVLTLDGETLNTFNINQGDPLYLSVNTAGTTIITSTNTGSSVQGTDLTGGSLFNYTDGGLTTSLGTVFDTDDNFLVCGFLSNNVHVVNKDGTRHGVILTEQDGINEPYCLAYRPSDKTLVVGQREGQRLLVFTVN